MKHFLDYVSTVCKSSKLRSKDLVQAENYKIFKRLFFKNKRKPDIGVVISFFKTFILSILPQEGATNFSYPILWKILRLAKVWETSGTIYIDFWQNVCSLRLALDTKFTFWNLLSWNIFSFLAYKTFCLVMIDFSTNERFLGNVFLLLDLKPTSIKVSYWYNIIEDKNWFYFDKFKLPRVVSLTSCTTGQFLVMSKKVISHLYSPSSDVTTSFTCNFALVRSSSIKSWPLFRIKQKHWGLIWNILGGLFNSTNLSRSSPSALAKSAIGL